jgi:hypothetical protein
MNYTVRLASIIPRCKYRTARINADQLKITWLYRVAYAKALHACVYSREGLIECLKVCHVPFDEGIAALHKNGRAYITNPMLADQYPGYSDIRQKRVDYSFMGKRYEEGKA